MSTKIDYISSHFKKIQHKKYELYVLSRLWHQLNDDDIHFVFQKCLYRDSNGKRALADLFLPQFNMLVEVDEQYHDQQVAADELRTKEILNMCKTEVEVIRVSISKGEVNEQISKIIDKIRKRKAEKQKEGTFAPWSANDKEFTAAYHISKGYLDVDRGDFFLKTNEAFGTFFPEKRYQSSGAVLLNDPRILLWCPKAKNKQWKNTLSEDGEILEEVPTDDSVDTAHWFSYNKKNAWRVIFLKENTEYDKCLCRFIGVFRLDQEQSSEHKCIWRRVAKRLTISKQKEVAINEIRQLID